MTADANRMDSRDLQRFVDANRIAATVLALDVHTATVADAAAALNVETERIIKSLVFRLGDTPLLVINNGLARVDRRKLAAHLQVGRKRVKFATPDEALAITGYPVGAMPPFGHRRPMRTLVDAAVTGWDVVYGGGGDVAAMMRVTSVDLLRVTEAEIGDISEPAAPG